MEDYEILAGRMCRFPSVEKQVDSKTGNLDKILSASSIHGFSRQWSLETARISTSTKNPSRQNHCGMSSLVTLLLIALYGGGVWKFWKGYQNTNFERRFQNRLFLSLLWPVLYVANKSYRQNFSKALKGSRR